MFGFNKRQKYIVNFLIHIIRSSNANENKLKKSYDYEYADENLDFISEKKEENFSNESEYFDKVPDFFNIKEEEKQEDAENFDFIESKDYSRPTELSGDGINSDSKNKILLNDQEEKEKLPVTEPKKNISTIKDKFPKKEKQSYNYLKYKYNDSKEDNLNTNIQNKFKQSYSEDNAIYDMDAVNNYTNAPQEGYTSDTKEEKEEELDYNYNVNNLQLSESEDEKEKFKHKIKEIKDLRVKKRETEYKEETYDQDFVEMKQTKTSEMIEDVYNLYESNELYNLKNIEDQSDSEKELIQWELDKLKNGINSKWAMNRQKKMKEENKNKNNNIFDIFNTIKIKSINLSDVKNKVEEDLINTELNYESLKIRKENYEAEIIENSKRKEEYLKKANEYIEKYRKSKEIYYKIIKILKKNAGQINVEKIKQMINKDDVLNISD